MEKLETVFKKLIIINLALVICFPLWLQNSSLLSFPQVQFYLSLFLLFLCLFKGLFTSFDEQKRTWNIMYKDVALWFGLLFLVYLFIQYYNSGAVREFSAESYPQVRFVVRKYAFLPFSYNGDSALVIFRWWFCALSIIIAFKYGLDRKTKRIKFLHIIMANAAILALVGFVHYHGDIKNLFGSICTDGDHFFATFGYENFGGSFFTLMTSLALGLAFYYFDKNKIISIIYGILSFVYAYAVMLTFTRFCYIMVAFLYALAVIAFLIKIVRLSSFKIRVASLIVLLAGSLVFYACYQNLNSTVKRDIASLTDNKITELVEREVQARSWQWYAAAWLWSDYPAFGTGYNSMRYIQQMYLPEKDRQLALGYGKANTHNDFLQSLSEFGVVGTSLLFLFLLALVLPILCKEREKSYDWLLFFMIVGIMCNLAHAIIDLPYRNCSNILTTVALLGIFSTLVIKRNGVRIKSPEKAQRYFKAFSMMVLAGFLTIFSYGFLQLLFGADIEKIRLECAKKSYESNDASVLHNAVDQVQKAYLSNEQNRECAMLFADIMLAANYHFEAVNCLNILYRKNKDDLEVRSRLYKYHIKTRNYLKAMEFR